MRLIQYGDADVMVAGGAECSTTPTAIGGFIAARALSQSNDDPARTSRPWDKDRDGFVLSDGAGVLVLEEYEHAKARGARIYAEVAGFGMSDDAFHMTAPPEDGAGAAASMRNAVRDAGVGVDTVEYVNAHATSTPLGDVAETRAIRTCFGAHADRLMVSSTKSVTGHLLGAAGGVEAIFSVLALHDGVIPPTINLDAPGEGCDLDYVPNTARRKPVSTVVSNSFGFGGTNGTLLFRRL
jgi:3-oxoacyl-[acyl-carrier-protein] synthase II